MKFNKNDLSTLYDILTRPALKDFFDLGGVVISHPQDNEYQALWIRSSEHSKVLAVAHTDYVVFSDSPKISFNCNKILCPQLDDRLGAWLILCILHRFIDKDMPYDILLTDNEECGKSTGILFNPTDKKYNWMFQFDRMGTDVVMYDYETPELKKLLQEYDFKVGFGTFTDICVMDRLGCPGFNFGTSYYQQHSKSSWADIPELVVTLRKFLKFYKEQYHNKLEGDIDSQKTKREGKSHYLYKDDDDTKIEPSDKKGEDIVSAKEVAPFSESQR